MSSTKSAGRTQMRRAAVPRLLTAACLAVSATACSSAPGGSTPDTFSVWDPYPQFAAGSDWVRTIEGCAAQAGVKVQRQAYDTTDLTGRVLLAAQQRTAPQVLVVDNPVVSTLA